MSRARSAVRAALGLAVVALWWTPTAVWLFGGLWRDRARSWAVVLVASALCGGGLIRAARALDRAELQGCARRRAKLDRGRV